MYTACQASKQECQMIKHADGKYFNLDAAMYHADTAIGSSTIKTLATKTPAHVFIERKESTTFDFGTAVHMAMLEPEKISNIIRGPDDRRGKKWTDIVDNLLPYEVVLTGNDYDAVMNCVDVLMNDKDVYHLFKNGGEREVSVFKTIMDVRCKIRPDFYSTEHNLIVDLKTCASASPKAFMNSVLAYGYHIQAAYYQLVWNQYHDIDMQSLNFIFVAVEKTPPYAVGVYELDKNAMNEGMAIVDKYLSYPIKENRTNNRYTDGIQLLSLPSYGFIETSYDEIPAIG
jgi:exodeoxyribonuclease VIII